MHSFSITSTGLLASVPYLTRVPFAIMFGFIGDVLVKRKTMSTNAIRKVFSICCKLDSSNLQLPSLTTDYVLLYKTAHFIPGCFLIGIMFVGDQPYTCLAFITIGLCFNSAVVVTSMHNPHDIAPNFASSIYGIISFAGSSTGYVSNRI